MSLCCPGWPQISVLKGSSHLRLLGAGATGPSHTGLTAVFFTSVRGFLLVFLRPCLRTASLLVLGSKLKHQCSVRCEELAKCSTLSPFHGDFGCQEHCCLDWGAAPGPAPRRPAGLFSSLPLLFWRFKRDRVSLYSPG